HPKTSENLIFCELRNFNSETSSHLTLPSVRWLEDRREHLTAMPSRVQDEGASGRFDQVGGGRVRGPATDIPRKKRPRVGGIISRALPLGWPGRIMIATRGGPMRQRSMKKSGSSGGLTPVPPAAPSPLLDRAYRSPR